MVVPEYKEYEILLTEHPKHGILPSERKNWDYYLQNLQNTE